MQYFHNDYNEACHPAVLKKMQENMGKQMTGYGEDTACASAADMIRRLCKNDALAVHFLVGGTQANLTVIAAALRAHQSVLSAASAHIHVHETGAIEATGHTEFQRRKNHRRTNSECHAGASYGPHPGAHTETEVGLYFQPNGTWYDLQPSGASGDFRCLQGI